MSDQWLVPLFPLRAVLPEADIPPDATVSLADGHALIDDLALCGNAYVKPSGLAIPSHVRIPPEDVTLGH